MTIWKDFEEEATEYLNKNFGKYANFILQGGSNSTKEDIKVTTKNNVEFYIEAKHSPAQCGQFVLFPNLKTKKFEYSKQNVNRLNESALKIMSYMNENFDEFKNVGTAGKNIEFLGSQNIFCDWIVEMYKSKNVKFFITNNNTILPIEKFKEYFNVSAKYRVKKSGSSSVGTRGVAKVENFIMSKYEVKTIKDNGRLLVLTDQNLHNKHFVLDEQEYMFSKRNQIYEVRKLSKTYNANVIFSVQLKNGVQGVLPKDFISFLLYK